MVMIEIYRNGSGRVTGFNVSGHANFDDYGRDIVCAAVSALTHTAVFSLMSLARITPEYETGDGRFSCRVDGTDTPKQSVAGVILESMVIGLKEIEKQYPRHVRVSEITK